MKKKLLKIGACVLAAACFLGVGVFAACQSMGDLVPEKYGEWEGNYIYLGNGRCKTTGEDFERLVKTVETDGKQYTVSKCLSAQNKGNETYMVLECVYGQETEQETIFCLVKYDIDTHEQTLLHKNCEYAVTEYDKEYMDEYRPQEIQGIYEEYISLQGYKKRDGYDSKVWYTVDFEGNIVHPQTDDFEYWETLPNGYLVYEKRSETESNVETDYGLYYKKDPLSESIFVHQYRGSMTFYSDWYYVDENGVQGILIEERSRQYQEEYSRLQTLAFFDFSTNTLQTVGNLGSFAKLYDCRYLKTYDYTQVTYKESIREANTAKVQTDNVLYQIVYDKTGARLEEIEAFKDDRDITFYGMQGNELLYDESWFSDWRGCDYGGREWAYYVKDLETGEKREVEREEMTRLEDDFAAAYERTKGVTVGKYTYFIHEEEVDHGMMSSDYTAYMLKRYDAETEEIEVMQLWSEDANDSMTEQYGHYCHELWFGELNKYYEALFDVYSFRVA